MFCIYKLPKTNFNITTKDPFKFDVEHVWKNQNTIFLIHNITLTKLAPCE